MAQMTTNPGVLERHVTVSKVSSFAGSHIQDVPPKYRDVFSAICSLAEQYEIDGNLEWRDRSRELIRLILDRHVGLMRKLMSDADTWEDTKRFIRQNVERICSETDIDVPSEELYADIDRTITAALKTYVRSERFKKTDSEISLTDVGDMVSKAGSVVDREKLDGLKKKFEGSLDGFIDEAISKVANDIQIRNKVSDFRKKALEFGLKAVSMKKVSRLSEIGTKVSSKPDRIVGKMVNRIKAPESKPVVGIPKIIKATPSMKKMQGGRIKIAKIPDLRKTGSTFASRFFGKKIRSLMKTMIFSASKLVLGGVVAVLTPAFKLVKGVGKILIGGVKFLTKSIVKTAKVILSASKTVMNFAISVVGSVFSFIKNEAMGLFSFLKGRSLLTFLKSFFTAGNMYALGFILGTVYVLTRGLLKRAAEKAKEKFDEVMERADGFVHNGGEKFDEVYAQFNLWVDSVKEFVGDVFNTVASTYESIKDTVEDIYESIKEYLPESDTMKTTLKVVMNMMYCTTGVGGAIARNLPGIWKFVGYLINGAFKMLYSFFLGRKDTHLEIAKSSMHFFNAHVKKVDYATIPGLDKHEIESLTNKKDVVGKEIAEAEVLENTWNNDILPAIQEDILDVKSLGRFTRDVFRGTILGEKVDFGSVKVPGKQGLTYMELYNKGNADIANGRISEGTQKMVEAVRSAIAFRVSTLNEVMARLGDTSDLASLKNLASFSMKDISDHFRSKITKTKIEAPSVFLRGSAPNERISSYFDSGEVKLGTYKPGTYKASTTTGMPVKTAPTVESVSYKVGDVVSERDLSMRSREVFNKLGLGFDKDGKRMLSYDDIKRIKAELGIEDPKPKRSTSDIVGDAMDRLIPKDLKSVGNTSVPDDLEEFLSYLQQDGPAPGKRSEKPIYTESDMKSVEKMYENRLDNAKKMIQNSQGGGTETVIIDGGGR